ncbi:hypothetical protein BGP77_17625 [Saccharospirillum sp. MSK14-1]|uniref:hypothetical protein n=1 Tax=Saccharospirillum sp. MSK14-1 TaxID=1897632 RepID=UPI000D38E1F0|nr:hypothetical protein [Saccharospirillum sp. MSK14-1]PTY38259.1 hypothetical protein BGP77_17625 [Saccharospirillum sp. MSK14-1]
MKKAISTIGLAFAMGFPVVASADDSAAAAVQLQAENSINNRIAITGKQLPSQISSEVTSESAIKNVTDESITLTGIPSAETDEQEARIQSFSAQADTPSPQVFDPAYTPICTELSVDTVYTLTGTVTGESYCYYFAVTDDPVRIDSVLIGQQAGNDHDVTIAQDDPNNPYTFPTSYSSVYVGNHDERVSFVSDAGHYYFLIEAVESTGAAFNFALQSIDNFDEYEVNDTLATATELVHSETFTGNIDSGIDEDYYTYTTVGESITVEVTQYDPNHNLFVSYDEGASWSIISGSGRFDPPTEPGDVITFGVAYGGSLNPANPYSITVYDNRGLKISKLVGLIVNLHSSSGQNYLNKTLGNYRVDGYPVKGGVRGHYVRFFGQLKFPYDEPAPYMDFIFDYTLTEDGIGHWFHEVDVKSDSDGFFEILVPLNECSSFNTYTQRVPGEDPDIHYNFDLERFHIRADTVNGEQVLNTANEYFFNLCSASPGADILDPL